MLKNHRGFILAVSVLIVGLAVLPACSKKTSNEKMAENMLERTLEKATGQKADVDLAGGKVRIKDQGGQGEIEFANAKWPEDMPGDVVKFEDAKIKGVTRGQQGGQKSWMIFLEKVEAEAVDPYFQAFKDAGWTIEMSMDTGKGTMFQAKKEKLYLTGAYSKDEKILTLTIMTVNE